MVVVVKALNEAPCLIFQSILSEESGEREREGGERG